MQRHWLILSVVDEGVVAGQVSDGCFNGCEQAGQSMLPLFCLGGSFIQVAHHEIGLQDVNRKFNLAFQVCNVSHLGLLQLMPQAPEVEPPMGAQEKTESGEQRGRSIGCHLAAQFGQVLATLSGFITGGPKRRPLSIRIAGFTPGQGEELASQCLDKGQITLDSR